MERRLARTVEELEGEEGEDEVEEVPLSDDSDDDQDAVPYNPKNLPLGWDGKVVHPHAPVFVISLRSVSEVCVNYNKIGALQHPAYTSNKYIITILFQNTWNDCTYGI